MKKSWMGMVGIALVLALSLAYAAGSGAAVGDKDLTPEVAKVAAALKSGDKDGAMKMAAALAKKFDTMEDLMGLFGRKTAGGIGFGSDEKNGIDREIKL